ncbi:DUF7282 domain-containing protein [Hyphomicrobium sp. 2TAF46]|uniref:DUF7282 domain-containing protein n=1 Tax=Hyphomicrobium sp. 2TAF46 TaxID=3233019 RepID=UPI003F9033BE
MPHAPKSQFVLSAVAAAVIALAAHPAVAMTDQPANPEATAQVPASVLAFNQKLKGDAVSISYVHLPENGYVAVFADQDGKRSGKVLGFTALPRGNHNDVSVKISNRVEPGSAMWASLYKDVDGDKVLNAEKDIALWPNGEPLENRFVID